MNKGIKKRMGKLIASMALWVTKCNVNSTCMFTMHQPKLPQNAKKLRNN